MSDNLQVPWSFVMTDTNRAECMQDSSWFSPGKTMTSKVWSLQGKGLVPHSFMLSISSRQRKEWLCQSASHPWDKILKKSYWEQERFVLTYDFEGFCPWLDDSIDYRSVVKQKPGEIAWQKKDGSPLVKRREGIGVQKEKGREKGWRERIGIEKRTSKEGLGEEILSRMECPHDLLSSTNPNS